MLSLIIKLNMETRQSLDIKDKKILRALLNEGRASIADLAKKTGLKRDSVIRRIKRMQIEKTITGFAPLIEPAALGLPNFAILLIRTKTNPLESRKKIIRELANDKFVFHVAKIIGKYDLFCMLTYRDTQHLNMVLEEIKSFVPDFIEDIEVYPIAEEYKFQDMSQLL